MTANLIVVTFMAGSSWGPNVSMQQLPNNEICKAQAERLAEELAAIAKTNIAGAARVQDNSAGFTVVVNGPQGREIARVTCT